MKRVAILGVLLIALSGCYLPVVEDTETGVSLLSAPGVIYEPLVNGTPFSYDTAQPGDLHVLDFRTGRDQYGNPTGLEDDVRWRIEEVSITLETKAIEDDVFWPLSLPENVCAWYPGWNGPIDPFRGLPYSMTPLSVQPDPHVEYSWDACAEHSIEPSPSQFATAHVSAVAEWIEVGLVLPEIEGEYQIEWPGIPLIQHTSAATHTKRLGEPGTIYVTVPGEVLEYEVPVDWFWCDAAFTITVAPEGEC